MQQGTMERMRRSSHLDGNNLAYVEALYETFLTDPNDVPAQWREYFEKLPRVEGTLKADVPHSSVVQYFERLGRNRLKARPARESTRVETAHERLQMRVQDLVAAYRHRGHKKARIDPLGMTKRAASPILDLATTTCRRPISIRCSRPGPFTSARHVRRCGKWSTPWSRPIATRSAPSSCTSSHRGASLGAAAHGPCARPRITAGSAAAPAERLIEAEGLEKSLASQVPGHQAIWPRRRGEPDPHAHENAAALWLDTARGRS